MVSKYLIKSHTTFIIWLNATLIVMKHAKKYIKRLNRVMLHHNENMINFVIWQPY